MGRRNIVGDVTAGFILVIPGLTTFRSIGRHRAVGDRTCYPYLATLFNCIAWVMYGVPKKNRIIAIVNGIGIFLEALYCAMYIVFATGTKRTITIVLLIVELLIAGIFLSILLTVFRHGHHADAREITYGVLGAVSGGLMYLSPVMDMVNVIKTKDNSNMSFWLALSSLANAVTWTVYAVFKPINLYVLIPNVLDVACAAAQIIVFTIFFFKSAKEDDKKKADEEVNEKDQQNP